MFFDVRQRRQPELLALLLLARAGVCVPVLIASVIKFPDNDGDNDDTHPGSLLFLLHNDALQTSAPNSEPFTIQR